MNRLRSNFKAIAGADRTRAARSASWRKSKVIVPLVIAAIFSAILLPGCIGAPANPAATQPATAIDPKTAEPGYWYEQPGVASADAADFDSLWKACKLAARDDGFILDRPGYRDGVMTTQPLTSKQFFQPWLSDVVDTHSLIQSSLATMRRTIRFEMTRIGDGPAATWRCEPKVLVERYQVIERRITNETEYQNVFNLTPEQLTMQQERERDPSAGIQPLYWYPIGRDHALERQLAGLIRTHVSRPEDLRGIVPIG